MANKKNVAIIIIMIFVVVGAASVYFVTTSKTPAEHNITDDDSSGTFQATVIIENGTFNPSNLTVEPDTTVTWIVKDDSDEKFMVTGAGFMSPHLGTGQNFSFTFKEAGKFDYYDMDHMDDDQLKGSITVK